MAHAHPMTSWKLISWTQTFASPGTGDLFTRILGCFHLLYTVHLKYHRLFPEYIFPFIGMKTTNDEMMISWTEAFGFWIFCNDLILIIPLPHE